MKKCANTAFGHTWWGAGLAILGAVLAQVLLTTNHFWAGVGLYAVAICAWLCSTRSLWPGKTVETAGNDQAWRLSRLQREGLYIGLLAAGINVFASLGQDTFLGVGVIAWGISILALVIVFWEKRPRVNPTTRRITPKTIHITWLELLFLATLLLGTFFRAWHLQQTPPEMTMDHANNLLDIRDVVENGERPIFFYRNTGREPLQFYWTAALIWITRHPIDFTILKAGTALAGLLTLPGIYLLAREMYGRTVGLWAMGFAAVASWPVILSRLGLRVAFAPLFSTWAFYYFMRGLRRGKRESFLLLGLFLGAGLYSYTAFRVVPLAVAYVWLTLNMTEASRELRANLNWHNLGLVVIMAALVFVPLGAFALTHPYNFWGRSAWYMNNLTTAAPFVFLGNIKNVLLMFNWRGDLVPFNTLPYEPVLDPILGALFVLGVVMAIRRAVKKEGSLTFAILLLGIAALLPSTLSVKYPGENPSVMRTSCAIPIVFTLAALPVSTWVTNLSTIPRTKISKVATNALLGGLACALVATNAQRVFVRYPQAYRAAIANTSEIAQAIRCFDAVIGNVTDAYVVAGPGWIEDDALAFELGLPAWSNTLKTVGPASNNVTASRMYILHPDNGKGLQNLRSLFPTGLLHIYTSQYGKRFIVYLVPGRNVTRADIEDQWAHLETCIAGGR